MCDPRTLEPGEVRARQIPCSDELIDGGEGRVGDWLLENAHARYVIRGDYAALTHLGEEGGTLIDAARPGGPDLLLEYMPIGERGELVAFEADGEAWLELPGLTWRLGADDTALRIEGATSGVLRGRSGVRRTGGTLTDGSSFFGVDGAGASSGSVIAVDGVTRVALDPEDLWPDGAPYTADLDADAARVTWNGQDLTWLPVEDGRLDSWLPAGVTVTGERDGCAYEGVDLIGCGWLQLRVADDFGADLRATLTDGGDVVIPVPEGGGRVPVGPFAQSLWVWAGPTHSAARLTLPGGDTAADVTLWRAFSSDASVLAAIAQEVSPDVDTLSSAEEAANALAGEGVGFAVMVADDEIPGVTVDVHDPVLAVPASRAAELVWSWPWSANGKRPAHGAVPWEGLSALDLLAASEGGQSQARRTVVRAAWVAQARVEAPPREWSPRPDLLWMADLGDLPTYLALLDDWVDIAPVSERTWIARGPDRNVAAVEAGLVDGATTAGSGARLALTPGPLGPGGRVVTVQLDAPRWMAFETVSLWTSEGENAYPVDGASTWTWTVPDSAPWVVAVATGARARPWSADTPAWAVSGPLWLSGP